MMNNINELKLTDLETVSGGSMSATSRDSKFLFNVGLMDESYICDGLLFSWNSKSKNVDDAWASAGIVCCTCPFADNEYYLNGKRITRKEAFYYVANKCGVIIDYADYNYGRED